MCGIWLLVGGAFRAEHNLAFMKIMARGPDLTVVRQVQAGVWLGFHRLAIVQPGHQASEQPIVHADQSVVCNGEIYNHLAIKAASAIDELAVANGGSDCAAIIHAFNASGGDLRECCAQLDGVFAFAMADERCVYLGRDPIGVRPLFYGFTDAGELLAASEIKAIESLVRTVEYFPPGCCATASLKNVRESLVIEQYYSLPIVADRCLSMCDAAFAVRQTLLACVRKRLMGDRQFGFMLSGGLDSSLIASIASKYLTGYAKPIAYSVGFEDSPDLANAAIVADFLQIPHDILVITAEQCIAVIPEVVYALETYDPLVIRCGIPHYLLCKHVAATSDVKVLLSGEGADELFGSYAYMQRAPNAAYLHREIIRRLKLLHHYDVLRCDRATAAHGLEIRVPFLDKKFVDLVVRLPATYKLISQKAEKYLLRSAFSGWLPEEVLWRSKEGFSEALGKMDLGDIINEYAQKLISDEQFDRRASEFPMKTPDTKEELWYRRIFDRCFGSYSKTSSVIHTKVYKTAAWHQVNEKENCNNNISGSSSCNTTTTTTTMMTKGGGGAGKQEKRCRRRSTGSSTLSGIA